MGSENTIYTKLLETVASDNINEIKKIWSKDIDINYCFHTKVRKKGSRIRFYLLENSTLLHYAVYCVSLKIIDFLLSKGADMYALDYWNRMPLFCLNDSFCETQNEDCSKEIIELFLKYGYNIDYHISDHPSNQFGSSLLEFAFIRKNLDLAKFIISKGAEFDTEYSEIASIIFTKCLFYRINNIEVLEYLLNFDPYIVDLFNTGEIFFHKSKLVVLHGIIPLKENISNYLIYLISHQCYELAKLLVDRGACINYKTHATITTRWEKSNDIGVSVSPINMCLDHDFNGGKIDMLSYLIKKGADLNIIHDFISWDQNSQGFKYENMTMVDLAIQNEQQDLLTFLSSKGAKSCCELV